MRTFDKSEFYITQKIGPKRSLTPEGYLLCEDVAVGRTGTQIYADHELVDEDGVHAVEPNGTGVLMIERYPEEVFRKETMASAHGKPITIGHQGMLTPETAKQFGVGNMSNLRRGEGPDADTLRADLLLTDKEAIRAVQEDGVEEVSLGYNSVYEQLAPGRAAQRNIVINHLAIVPNARCGPRCAIGDEVMALPKTSTFADRIRRAFTTKDCAEGEKIAKEMEDAEREEEEEKAAKKTEDAMRRVLDAALKPMRDDIAELKKDKETKDAEEEEKKKTEDAELTRAEKTKRLDESGVQLYSGDAAAKIKTRAEVISPGFRFATLDAKASDADKAASLIAAQRKVLGAHFTTDQGRKDLEPFLAGQTIDALPVANLNAAFIAVSEIVRIRNNSASTSRSTNDFGIAPNKPDIANRYIDFGKQQSSFGKQKSA